MTLDEVMERWRSQDASTLFGVDEAVLHQVLQQEHARLEKQWRGERRVMSVAGPLFVIIAAVHLASMIYSNPNDVFSVWDYVVGVVGVAAAFILAGAMFALIRSRRAREQNFGDSLRDHLQRRIAQLDDEATAESRIGFVTLVAGLVFMWAIPFVGHRINDVPHSESDWPSPLVIVVVLGFICWVLFRSMPRERKRKLSRRRQLEALLKELDGQ